MTANTHGSHSHGKGLPEWARWALSALTGLGIGLGLGIALPSASNGAPSIELWMVIPFAGLLLSIALMPFVSKGWWHHNYPNVSFFLGALVAGFYLTAFGIKPGFGSHAVMHAAIEYYMFIALVGGLYVVSGGIEIGIQGRPSAFFNTLLLGVGAVLANLVGTTGASVLLIRPFLKLNEGRIHPLHIVLFIFIVSNCGGSLTPIGDPPLYIGYLKGLPFDWNLRNMGGSFLIVVLSLLAVFYAIDSSLLRRERVKAGTSTNPIVAIPRISIRGVKSIVCLALIIVGVFIDPLVAKLYQPITFPLGATFQLLVTIVSLKIADESIVKSNEFTWEPVREVGLLFVGIFLTMIPALGYLSTHGDSLKGMGLESATSYYFATGLLSATLDNAPTYLNFVQIALAPSEVTPEAMRGLIATREGTILLEAISTGAVFFGAMTYIGNGPNFMVKAIAEAKGIRMPSFFGYLGWAMLILFPVLVLHWFVIIR